MSSSATLLISVGDEAGSAAHVRLLRDFLCTVLQHEMLNSIGETSRCHEQWLLGLGLTHSRWPALRNHCPESAYKCVSPVPGLDNGSLSCFWSIPVATALPVVRSRGIDFQSCDHDRRAH
jgi:hypothetical protein